MTNHPPPGEPEGLPDPPGSHADQQPRDGVGPRDAEHAREELRIRSVALHGDPRFRELRSRLLRFVVPMSIAFLSWYTLYVVMSVYARGVLSTQVLGSVNLALVFGLLQFVTTFGIAIWYSLYMNRRFDPLADELRTVVERGERP